MSFAKSKTIRFNDATGCAPPVGLYDTVLKKEETLGPISFEKTDRFKTPKNIETCNGENQSFVVSTPRKQLNVSQISSDSQCSSVRKSKVSHEINNSKINDLEKEIRHLLQERAQLLKDVSCKEEEYKKIDSKFQIATREKTQLNASIATLSKELKELKKGNEILKSKISTLEQVGTKRHEQVKELSLLKEELILKKQEIEDLRDDLNSAKDKLELKVKECKTKEDELVQAQSKWESAKNDVEDANILINELSEKNKTLDDLVTDLCDELNVMENRMGQLQDFNLHLSNERELLVDQTNQLQSSHSKEVHDFLSKLSDLDQENKILNSHINKLELEYNGVKMENDVFQGSSECNERLQDYKNSLELRIESQKSTIKNLTSQIDSNESTIRNLEEEIKFLKQDLYVKEQNLFETSSELAEMSEALNEMETNEQIANENLKILSDKISELEAMLDFERNANKENEKTLDTQLELTKDSLDAANAETAELRAISVSLISQLNSEKDLANEKMMELEKLKDELEQSDEKLAARNKDFEELWELSQAKDKDMEEMNRSKESIYGELCKLKAVAQNRLGDLNKQKETVKESFEHKDKQLMQLESDKIELMRQIEVIKEINVVIQDNIRSRESTLKDLNENLDAEKKKNELLMTEQEKLKRDYSRDEMELISLNKELSELKEVLETNKNMKRCTEDKMKEMDDKLLSVSEKLSTKDNLIVKLEIEVKERDELLQMEMNTRKKSIEDSRNELSKLVSERDGCLLEITSLKESLSSYQTNELELKNKMNELLDRSKTESETMENKLCLIEFDSDGLHKQIDILLEMVKDSQNNELLYKAEIEEIIQLQESEKRLSMQRKEDKNVQMDELTSKISAMEEEMRDKEVLHADEITALEIDYKRQIAAIEDNTNIKITEATDELNKNLEQDVNKWRNLYESLEEKIKPFKEQLDMYENEKCILLNQNSETMHNLVSLSEKYAKLLGHHNQKQKIKHVMKLKQENLNLKHELNKMRDLCAKQKRQLDSIQERFVSGEMQRKHSERAGKENCIRPTTPLSDNDNIRNGSNRVLNSKTKSETSLNSDQSLKALTPRVSTNYGMF